MGTLRAEFDFTSVDRIILQAGFTSTSTGCRLR